jgi:hypothetical protein
MDERTKRKQDYLAFIRANNTIEGNNDSDDAARDIVRDAVTYATLNLREKALLALEMIDGFTGNEDEKAILDILQDVQSRGILQDFLLMVPLADLKSDLHGAEYDELLEILGREPFQITFEDCPRPRKQMLLSAVQSARSWVDTAVSKVSTLVANPATVDPTTHKALQDHFHIASGPTAQDAVGRIRRRLLELQSAFTREVPFECETQCDTNVHGYVYTGLFGLIRTASDVHMCPDWFASTNSVEKAATIIHEMSHKYSGTDDKAYEWETAKYQGLSTGQALDNAESFGAFVRDVR